MTLAPVALLTPAADCGCATAAGREAFRARLDVDPRTWIRGRG